MKDKIEDLLGATVQHGPLSDRIYLMHMGDAEPDPLIESLHSLARDKGYGKIFAKVPGRALSPFLNSGFVREATVPAMYSGKEDAFFLARFLDTRRSEIKDRQTIYHVLEVCEKKSGMGHGILPPGFTPRLMTEDDCPEMARLYCQVFDSYPFPITDPDYLLKTMRSHVIYAGMYHGERLAALASAEVDPKGKNAEMTDFATRPEFRENRLATHLLEFLIHKLGLHPLLDIRTGYTIARCVSYGINIAFARCGFTFGGILVNNTNIAGEVESMNVWYKPLSTIREHPGEPSAHLIPPAE